MKQPYCLSGIRSSVVLWVGASLLAVATLPGQTTGLRPEEIVQRLTDLRMRPGDYATSLGLSSCGDDGRDRELAAALVGQGEAAAKVLAVALQEVLEGRRGTFNLHWLTDAYATLKGAGSLPLLRRLAADGRFSAHTAALDCSMAISLGLSSWVTLSLPAVSVIRCQGAEPRDGLNQLILAWIHGDKGEVLAALGPNAAAGLETTIGHGTWARFRDELGAADEGSRAAIGYQLMELRPVVVPELRLPGRPDQPSRLDILGALESRVRFANELDADCATVRVEFVVLGHLGGAPSRVLVNSRDLRDILRSISRCASSTARQVGPL